MPNPVCFIGIELFVLYDELLACARRHEANEFDDNECADGRLLVSGHTYQ